FFSSRRRHTRSYGDWSSDVCSSDLFLHGGMGQDHSAPKNLASLVEVFDNGDVGPTQAGASSSRGLDLQQGGMKLTAQGVGQFARVVLGQNLAQLKIVLRRVWDVSVLGIDRIDGEVRIVAFDERR